ncbi:MAG: hypothetical protein CMJ46_06170 [Planctomyces sp.]|nr:hypothetical protein [Planctomyces sp.]
MLKRTFLVICCLASLLCVESASAQLRLTSQANGLPTKDLLARYALTRGWWGQAVVDPLGDRVIHISVDEAFVYVQTDLGNITALDVNTGKRAWYYRFGSNSAFISRAVSDAETVYFIAGVHLIALDRFSGNEKWMLRLPGPATSQIAVDDDQIFFGDVTGMFYALDLGRINQFARDGDLPNSSFDTVNWRYRAADQIRYTPLLIEDEVVFTGDDGTVYGLAKADKKQFMHFEGDSPIVAPLSHRGRLLYMSIADRSSRQDKRIFCLNQKTGETVWQRVLTQPVLQRMIVVGENLYAVPARVGLMMMNADTGQRFWVNTDTTRFLAQTESFVLGEDDLRNITLIDKKTGITEGRLPLRDFSIRFQNEQTDRLYLARLDGIVVEIHELGSEFPIQYRNQGDQPIEPEMAPNDATGQEGDATEPAEPATNNNAEGSNEPQEPETPQEEPANNNSGFRDLFGR